MADDVVVDATTVYEGSVAGGPNVDESFHNDDIQTSLNDVNCTNTPPDSSKAVMEGQGNPTLSTMVDLIYNPDAGLVRFVHALAASDEARENGDHRQASKHQREASLLQRYHVKTLTGLLDVSLRRPQPGEAQMVLTSRKGFQ